MENQDPKVPSLFTTTLVQLLLLVLLLVALLNSQRELTILALLVLGVITSTRIWTRASLAGLHCHLTIDKYRVFPGEGISLHLNAENAKLLPIWLESNIPIGNFQTSTVEQVLTEANSLLWYEKTHLHWKLVAERRGVHSIGPLDIRAGDLFSFFSRRAEIGESHSVIVYPRLVALKSFSLPRRDFFGIPRAKSLVQDPIYILGTRDYQPGQPSKFIHWKASAHRNRLQEKVFESTVQEKVLLVVDAESFADHEATEGWERMLEVVASLAVRLDRQGHSVGLVTNAVVHGNGSKGVPIARNEQQVATILGVLATLDMKSAREMNQVLRQGMASVWGITCIYFSCADDETIQFAEQYFRQNQTPAMFVVNSLENENKNWLRHKVYRLDDLRADKAASR